MLKSKRDLRIVFMGTPEFAVISLEKLILDGYNITGVVTVADKVAGRGLKPIETPVKKYAVEHNIVCLQPEKLKAPDFLGNLKSLEADLFIVVAFRMLPDVVWQMPKYGTVNLHASLLPNYRGAAPINHAIINGETVTGVTTFFINKDIDTGNIIDAIKVDIDVNDNAGTLHDKLAYTGAILLKKTIDKIIEGNIQTVNQFEFDQALLKIAPKINKEYCLINFERDVNDVHNFIRGLSPYPGAYTYICKETEEKILIKIFKTRIRYDIQEECIAGNIITDNKTYLCISAKNAWIEIEELQIASKKKMNVKNFFNGNKIDEKSYCLNC